MTRAPKIRRALHTESPIMLPHLCVQLASLPQPLRPLNKTQQARCIFPEPGAHGAGAPAAQAAAGVWRCESIKGRGQEGPGESDQGRNQESRNFQKLDPGVSRRVSGRKAVAGHSKVCPWVQQPTISDLERTL